MNKKPEWIICFGSPWESPSVYTEKHLINRYYNEGKKILWIDPIPNKQLSLKRDTKKKVFFIKILNKLRNQFSFFKIKKKHFYVYKPFYNPKVELKYSTNKKYLKRQVKLLIKLLKIKNFGIFSSTLIDIPYIFNTSDYEFFVQISGDLYSDLRDLSKNHKARLIEVEKNVFNCADFILTASKVVYNKIQKKVYDESKIIYFPHGVDYQHFSSNYQKIRLFDKIKRPIVGYFGSLTHANDQNVFISLAQAGFSVVLIGKVRGDYSKLKNIKDIYFLGPVEYNILPSYAINFDVCIMSWKPAEWIKNSNPSKTFEYLALGKPIVSVTIPQLKHEIPDFVYFADSPEDFVLNCKKAISDDNQLLINKRKERARQEDWDMKFKLVKNLLNEKFKIS